MDSTELTPDARDLIARLRRGELVAAPRLPTGNEVPEAAGAEVVAPVPTPTPERRPTGGWRGTLADRLPLSVRGALLDPAARGALLLGLVALAAALVALGLAWRAAPRPVALPSASASAPVVSGAAPPTAAAATTQPSASASPAGRVVVDVAGKVVRPGVVTLPTGARVADALARAGGVLPGTDTSALSLARRLTDGEQVLVTGKAGTVPAAATTPAAGGAAGSTGPIDANAPGVAPSGPLDLNSATVEQFDALPGVGPVLAARIVEFRTAHNGFSGVDQLRQVKGLGGKTGSELLPLVTVG